MSESTRYSKLAAKDEGPRNEEEMEALTYRQAHPPNSRLSRHQVATFLAAAFIVGMLTMGILIAAWSFLTNSINRSFPDIDEGFDKVTGLPLAWFGGECGGLPKDAVSRGCRYSAVLHAWLPERCLEEEDDADAQLMYEGRQAWNYELPDGRNMTSEEMRAGDFDFFYTSNDWHVAHCMYVWKRAHRAMMDAGRAVDAYTASTHHTDHCVKMISGNLEDMGNYTKVFVKYPKCS